MTDPVRRPPIDVDKVMNPERPNEKEEPEKKVFHGHTSAGFGKHANGRQRPKNWRQKRKQKKKPQKTGKNDIKKLSVRIHKFKPV